MKKNKVIIILSVFLFLVIICAFILYHEQKVPVLGYHFFYKYKGELRDKNDEFINDINEFEKQMKYLKKHNYKTLTLDEFYCWKKGKCKVPRNSVLITIDDGNLSNYMYAFDVLKKYDFNAVVFFVSSQAENGVEKGSIYDCMSLKLIEKAKKEYPNIEFMPHSYNMHAKPVTDYSLDEIKNDLKNIKRIGDFKYYAYPFGVYDDRMIKELKNNNYKMAFGFGPRKDYRKARRVDDDYKVPRLNISSKVSYLKFKLRLLNFF